MKIRNGFVSNSSSTSFAVSINNYPTVRDLAVAMMDIRNSDWDEFSDEEVANLTIKHAQTNDDKIFEEIRDAIEFPTNNKMELEFLINSKMDKDIPTAFHTCNYDTYIKKSGEYIFVATCNNHCWEDIDYMTRTPSRGYDIKDFMLSDEQLKDINDGNESLLDALEFSLQYSGKFWWPIINTKIRQIHDTKCKNDKCFSMLVEVENGELKCPKCDLNLGSLY